MSGVGYRRDRAERQAKAESGRPFRTGFCHMTNPPDSHDRCPIELYGLTCTCWCHQTPAAETAPSTVNEVPSEPVAAATAPAPRPPGSPEWFKRVTASKVAAILGVSPYESQRSIWHKMHGDLPHEQPATSAQARGHYLEPAILAWWRDQHPAMLVDCHAVEQREHQHEHWAAATPDLSVYDDLGGLLACIVEAKSARNMDDWGDPGTDVIPAYYLTQVYFQLAVTGAPRCYVPVIGPWLQFHEYVVEADQVIQADLLARMRSFWDSLAADEPPDIDDSLATYETIRKVHPEIDRGEVADLTPDEAGEYVTACNAARDAVARERLAKSTVLERMGRAQYADCDGVRVARRQPHGDAVTLRQVAKTTDEISTERTAAA